jgi:hypothetical protein
MVLQSENGSRLFRGPDPGPRWGRAQALTCSIALTALNGIVLPGQTAPPALRVTGTATQCSSDQVLASSSLTANATTPIDPNGRFRIELPIAGSRAGLRRHDPGVGGVRGSVAVQYHRVSDGPRLQFGAHPVLPGDPAAGLVLPTDLLVQGVLLGCAPDQVIGTRSRFAPQRCGALPWPPRRRPWPQG